MITALNNSIQYCTRGSSQCNHQNGGRQAERVSEHPDWERKKKNCIYSQTHMILYIGYLMESTKDLSLAKLQDTKSIHKINSISMY